jgi:uncharacterized protein
MTRPLYVDTSALLRRVLNKDEAAAIDQLLREQRAADGAIVSSRLLWLEARRAAVRERSQGNDITTVLEQNLQTVQLLPMTDAVWERAFAIETHVKTLDSLHLATCALVDATLMSFDAQMRAAALAMGVRLAT